MCTLLPMTVCVVSDIMVVFLIAGVKLLYVRVYPGQPCTVLYCTVQEGTFE